MDDDFIAVHCGRCGNALVMRIDDLRVKRTVDCRDCNGWGASHLGAVVHARTDAMTPSEVPRKPSTTWPSLLRDRQRYPQ